MLASRGIARALLAQAGRLQLGIVGRNLFDGVLVGVAAGLVGAALFAGFEYFQRGVLEELAGYIPLRAEARPSPRVRASITSVPGCCCCCRRWVVLACGLICRLAPETARRRRRRDDRGLSSSGRIDPAPRGLGEGTRVDVHARNWRRWGGAKGRPCKSVGALGGNRGALVCALRLVNAEC